MRSRGKFHKLKNWECLLGANELTKEQGELINR